MTSGKMRPGAPSVFSRLPLVRRFHELELERERLLAAGHGTERERDQAMRSREQAEERIAHLERELVRAQQRAEAREADLAHTAQLERERLAERIGIESERDEAIRRLHAVEVERLLAERPSIERQRDESMRKCHALELEGQRLVAEKQSLESERDQAIRASERAEGRIAHLERELVRSREEEAAREAEFERTAHLDRERLLAERSRIESERDRTIRAKEKAEERIAHLERELVRWQEKAETREADLERIAHLERELVRSQKRAEARHDDLERIARLERELLRWQEKAEAREADLERIAHLERELIRSHERAEARHAELEREVVEARQESTGAISGQLLEIAQRANQAEFHAFSVRQLTAQRERLLVLLDLIGHQAKTFRRGSLLKIAQAIRSTPAEHYADICCLILNGGKTGGFFVEFGACDGLLISNTIVLEKQFEWTGILAEPSPRWQPALAKNRSCILDHRCVWSRSNETIALGEAAGDEYHSQSSVITTGHPGGTTFGKSYEVETVSLLDLLAQHRAPSVIDFISIDVEAAELAVLGEFDFSRYRFEFAAIETRYDKDGRVDALMRDKGYAKILAGASPDDSYFVPLDRSRTLPDWALAPAAP
ncbi:MAG: FkbM family methyltransferase [Alphaproteobacteria bacterium]